MLHSLMLEELTLSTTLRHVACLGLAGAAAWVAKLIVKPKLSALFILASFASQLHIPILSLHGGASWWLWSFVPSSPLKSAYLVVTSLAYIVIAHDFLRGFRIPRPIPHFIASQAQRAELKRRHKRHHHAMKTWFVRWCMMACPPLFFVITRIFNTKHKHIRYTNPQSHVELHLDIVSSKSTKLTDKRPVVLYVHGGAWVVGKKDSNGTLPVHYIASMGWICVTIDYR
jgi:hypothetical protein